LAAELAPILQVMTEVIHAGQRDGTFRDIDPLRFLMIVTGATAFLTFGMNALTPQASTLEASELHAELRRLIERVLFVD